MAATHVIKKYANRRLYDAVSSRHVTLEDLRKLIVAGETIQVIDDKSGEDLTRAVLLQVIAEQEQFGRPILTVPVLEAVIRFYGNAMQEFMTRHLEQSVRTFMEQQAAAQAQLAQIMAASPLNPLGDLARQNFEAWTRMQASLLGGIGAKPKSEGAATGTTESATSAETVRKPSPGRGKRSPRR